MADDRPQASEGEGAGPESAPGVDALIERHLPGLLAYVRLHSGPLIRARESCSDLAQSVCREVLSGRERLEYRGEAPFRKWLFAKAMSKILDRQRYWMAQKRDPDREQRYDELSDGALLQTLNSVCSPSEAVAGAEDLERFERVFAGLPEDYRRVILLARIVGCSHAEIAEELGCTEGASRMLLNRALVRLAAAMNRDEDA